MKKIIEFSLNSFPIVIIFLLLNMIVLKDSDLIIAMTVIDIFIGVVLKLFWLRRIILNILSKLLFTYILFIGLSNFVFFELSGRILFVVSSLLILFFGSKIYKSLVNDYVIFTSFLTLIASIFLFILLRNIDDPSLSLQIIVPVVIILNTGIAFFRNNYNELSNISKTRHKIPAKLVRSNRIMVAIAIVIVIIIGFIKEITEFVEMVINSVLWVIGFIIKGIISLMTVFKNDAPSEGQVESGNILDQLPVSDNKESMVFKVLEYVFYAIVIIVLFLLVYFLSKMFIRFIKRIFKYLLGYFEKGKTNTGYIDIIETQSLVNIAKEKVLGGIKEYIDDRSERFKLKSISEKIRYLFIFL